MRKSSSFRFLLRLPCYIPFASLGRRFCLFGTGGGVAAPPCMIDFDHGRLKSIMQGVPIFEQALRRGRVGRLVAPLLQTLQRSQDADDEFLDSPPTPPQPRPCQIGHRIDKHKPQYRTSTFDSGLLTHSVAGSEFCGSSSLVQDHLCPLVHECSAACRRDQDSPR